MQVKLRYTLEGTDTTVFEIKGEGIPVPPKGSFLEHNDMLYEVVDVRHRYVNQSAGRRTPPKWSVIYEVSVEQHFIDDSEEFLGR